MVRRTELSPLLGGGRRERRAWGVLSAALAAVGCICAAGVVWQSRSSSALLQGADPGEQLRLARQLWAQGSGLEYEGQLELRRARAIAMQILLGNGTNGTLGVNGTNTTNGTAGVGGMSKEEFYRLQAENFLTIEDRGVNVDHWPFIHERRTPRQHNDSYLGPPDKYERPEENKKLEESGVHVGRWFWDDKDFGESKNGDKYIDVYSTSGFNQHDTFNYDDWLHKKQEPAAEEASEQTAAGDNATLGLNATNGTNATGAAANGAANGTAGPVGAPVPKAPAAVKPAAKAQSVGGGGAQVPGHKLKNLGLNVDDWLIFGHRKKRENRVRLFAPEQRQLRVKPLSREAGMEQLRNIGDSSFRSLGDFLDDQEVGRSKTFYTTRHHY